ncbi:unnamed protein product [Didymodactylos carnosus]|uniref:Tetratricopeptide repeat protein n=1 Tax=Didymodactylos carnosus TaxID=1234261 RepID=A0A815XBT2_9BILA|nr:unnamed protein product [Didymodactylos carnosus]CAF4416643.1 unnamed protein product [Didymodactylos carnosus]
MSNSSEPDESQLVDQLFKDVEAKLKLDDGNVATVSSALSTTTAADLPSPNSEVSTVQRCYPQYARDANARQQLITFCCHYYRGNTKEQRHIDESERDYTAANAIHWYTKQSFLYRLVNKALRTEDIEQLHIFRFFIANLSLALADIQRQSQQQSTPYCIFLSRGAKLEAEELNMLKENQDQLISLNGFYPQVSLMNIGSIHRDMGELDKALTYLEDALKMQVKLYGKLGEPFQFQETLSSIDALIAAQKKRSYERYRDKKQENRLAKQKRAEELGKRLVKYTQPYTPRMACADTDSSD